MAASGATLVLPSMPTQAAVETNPLPLPEALNHRLVKPVISFYGGTSKESVDAALFTDVASYRSADRTVSVLADERLSGKLATLRNGKDYRLWLARIEAYHFSEVDGEHDVAWSFFGSLRMDPDVLVFQTPEDRLAWKGQDWLGMGWDCGHAVSLGTICSSREEMFRTVYAMREHWWWDTTRSLDRYNAYFDGENVSRDFRDFLVAAKEAPIAA